MNLLGFDVNGLDVDGFLGAAQALYPCAALLLLLAVVVRRSPRLLLSGVLLANVWAFALSTWPLQRLYALGPSRDRINNLGLCQVVAAGSPPWQTSIPEQLHFEPFWGLLMALLSGFEPARLERLYAFMPLLMLVAFVLALEFRWRRPAGEAAPGEAWERALVAGFATLLCASPLDWLWSYRVSWALTFLLKPNHALALVLLPLVLRVLARARLWPRLVGAGFLLHLLGWAFVIHMGLVAGGLVVYALLSWATGHAERRRDLRDVVVVLLVNVVIVSPYLYMLTIGYSFLVPRATAVVPPWSPHLLEVTFRAGWLFVLAAWGMLCLWRRGDRLSRLWSAQVLGALLAWAACLGLSALRLAREMDEFYYWARFLSAIGAAVGAWDLARRAWAWLGAARAARGHGWLARGLALSGADAQALVACALAATVLPASLPYWWNPSRMDPFFVGSLTPLPELIAAPMAYLRAHSRPSDVVVGDRDFAPWIPALAARRVLLSSKLNAPRDFVARGAIEGALARGGDLANVRIGYTRYGVRFLVATPSLGRDYNVTLEDLGVRPELRLVHLTQEGPQRYVAVFAVLPDALDSGGPR